MTTIELTGTDIDISEVDHEDYFIISQETDDKRAQIVLRAQDIPKIVEALDTVAIVKTLQKAAFGGA